MNIKAFIEKVRSVGFWNLALVLLAAALGADSAFAMADVTVVTEPTEKVPDSKGDPTQMPGVGASQSEAVESEFTPEEIDAAIAAFQAYQTPVEACISELAEKVNVESMEVIHYRSATPVFNITLLNGTSLTEDTEDHTITLTVGTHITKKNARLLYECKTVFCKGAYGYTEDGQKDGILSMYVLKNDYAASNGTVVLRVLNHDTQVSKTPTSLPAKAELILGCALTSESQREVAPDNFEPVPTKVYLAKRTFNIVMTLEWINGKKKVKFAEEDMRKGALHAYKIGNEIVDLIGTNAKFKVEAGRQMGDEYVYEPKGIIRQVNMYYSYEDGKLTPENLTAIAQMQFTKFSANREAQAFCGQDFIAMLLNMDLTVHKEIRFENVDFMGLTVKGWKNNFGQINFIYAPIFDLLGFDKCALLVDLKNARNYIKRSAQMETVDMRQGAAETRDAKRDIYSQIYGVALRGYNAMLIGPASQMADIATNFSNFTVAVESVEALPGSGFSTSVVYYLTKDSGNFKAGSFVCRNEANTSWVLYDGALQKV